MLAPVLFLECGALSPLSIGGWLIPKLRQVAALEMLFRLTDVHKSYGAQEVLRGATLQINPGEHVGLVGRNGAGKTTIFRLVDDEATPDRGEVVRARGLK